jgi:hypothetical protein
MKIDLGSKIENFMRDVLENGSDKEEAPTTQEVHDAQDKTLAIHENPGKKKFGKFLLLGLTALSLAGPVLAQDNEFDHSIPGTFQNEVAEVQATSVNRGYVGNNIHIATHILHENVGSNYEKIQDLQETTNNSLTHDNGVCDVNITYSQDGRSAFLGYTDELEKLSSPETEAQLKLNREMVLLHEMSHCEFAKMHNPLLVDGNPQLQEKMNYFFKYSSSSDDNTGTASSMMSTLNENFADTYAVVQMIKIHGLTPDMTRMIHSMGAQRQEKTLTQGEKDNVEAHATQNAMREVLEPSTLAKIQGTNDPEALKHIALEIANHSVGKLYSTYFDISEHTHDLTSFEDGVLNMVKNRIAQANITTGAPMDSLQNSFDNASTSFAVKVSDMVMANAEFSQIKINPSQIKNDGIVFTQEQNNKIYYLIQDVVSDNLRPEALEMRKVTSDYDQYLKQSFQAQNQDYLSSKNTQVEVAQKIFAVQDNYISQEGTASQKASLLARINQQRDSVNQNIQVASNNSQATENDSAMNHATIETGSTGVSSSLVSKIQQLRQANGMNSLNNTVSNSTASRVNLN